MTSRGIRGGKEIGGPKIDSLGLSVPEDDRFDMVRNGPPHFPAMNCGHRLADHGRHGPDPAEPVDDARDVTHSRKCSLLADALSTAKSVQTVGRKCAHNANMSDEHIALRVKRIREGLGLSVRAAASEMGLKPSSYGHYEDPARLKGPHLPMKFAKPFADLVARSGGNPDEVMALAGGTVLVGAAATGSPSQDLVTVYDIEVSAGNGYVAPDFEAQAGQLAFPPGYLRTITSAPVQALAIVTVKGDSMSPTLREGDVVMIDTTKRNLGFDGLFVLRMDGALHVKRVTRGGRGGQVRIMSDNRESYPATERELSEVEAVGKVLWYGRKE